MADKAIFEIVVTNKGLTVNQKGVDSLGASVEKTTQKTKDADKAAKNYNNTQEKGVIGTANSTKSFSKLAATLGESNGLVAAYAGLAANAFAVSAAFNVLNSAAQAQSVLEGLVVQGERAGKTLTVLSSKIKAITRDSISSTEAMQAVTLASSAGIAAEDLEKITQVATNASLALGRNIPDSLSRMTLAITKMEPELVDELGLTTKITEASERYARQNGITVASMTQAQKQQALLNAWVEQGTLKYDGLSEAVDPNPYQKLAATFRDLTTDGLKIINLFLDPFISLLGNSKGALLGLGAVFLSSIRGQILPGITGVSEAAFKAADQAKQISIDALKNEKGLSAGRRKSINEFIEASKEGVATQAQFEAAIVESEKRIEAARNRPRARPQTVAKVVEEETRRQAELTKIKEQSAKASVAQAQAMGYAASEGVTLTNGFTKLKATVAAMNTSFMASYNSVRNTQTGLISLGNVAKATGQGILAAGKVAAVGFLNFLPVIGQVIAGLMILWELGGRRIFEYLTGRTKEVTEALDNFNEVLDSTNGKVKAYEKIQLSTASASDRAAASISNQMSTVAEIADSYTQLTEAIRKRNEEESKSESIGKRQQFVYADLIKARAEGDVEAIKSLEAQQQAAVVAGRLGVDAASMAARAFAAQRTEFYMDDEYVAAAQALEQLENILPGVAKNFYDMNGGVEEFNNLPVEEKLKLINDQLVKTSAITRNVEAAFKSLAQSVESLNTGYADFIKSITPSTPYDGIVANLQGVRKGITDTEIAMEDLIAIGGDSSELSNRLAETLTGIEGPARNIFDPATRGALEYFDTLDSKLQRSKAQLEGMSTSQAGYADKVKEVNDLETKRNSLLQATSTVVQQGLSDYQTLVTNAQVEAITREGTLALAQAHLAVLQKQGQVTGEDIERQMRAENAIIELQASQLDAQAAILQVDIDREKAALRLIEANKETLKILKEQTAETRIQSIESQKAAENKIIASLRSSTDPESARILLQAERRLELLDRAGADIEKEIRRTDAEYTEAQNNIRVREAALNSLLDQAKALRAGANTEAEILNAKIKKNIENERELAAIKRATEEADANVLAIDREIAASLDYGVSSLQNQTREIAVQATLKRNALQEEQNFRERTLEAEIELARVRGNQSQITYYTNLLNAENERFQSQLDQIDAEERKAVIQQASIKSIEEENTLRKASLDIIAKITESQNALLQATAENIRAYETLNRKRIGATNTEAFRERQEIEAAQQAYDIAKNEVETKVALIELEFNLLKAKRALMMSEISQRISILAEERDRLFEEEQAARRAREERGETPGATAEDGTIIVTADPARATRAQLAAEQVATLQETLNAITAIGGDSIDSAMENAVKAVRLNVETLGVNVQTALEPGPRVTDGFMAMFRGLEDRATKFEARLKAARESRADTDEYNDMVDPSRIALITDAASDYFDTLRSQLSQLGPEGEIVIAVMNSALNISNSFQDAFAVIGDANASTVEKVSAGLQALSSIISGVMSILSSVTNARIANIDKEIAAEEKRDGKSAASVAKIEAMEKKKDSIARKSFNTNKKLMMANAVISTAAGIANALGSGLPPPANIILAGLIGAMGAAQLAIIAGTQYESTYTPRAMETPSSLSIGRRGDSVDLARGPNYNAGGEVGYLRGSQGMGTNSSNFNTIGSAYGGELMRGYGNRGFVVGEKGPEVITPETPITVTPANETNGGAPINATISIQALDASDVQRVLVDQRGNIIQMLREAANASGQRFLEDVNVNVYTSPQVNRL